ncbi:MAG: hypothetical protein PHQ83_10655 [Eubacteriales bacterium]|nr:hypothetical protein [Eubacteriales bacterium]
MNKTVAVTSFDWDGFLEETSKNLENLVDDNRLVLKVIDGQVIFYEDGWKSADLLEELAADEIRLFVPFAVDNLDTAVVLADGTTKLYVDPTLVSPEDEDDYEQAIEQAREFLVDEKSESVGFLFALAGEDLVITAGWFRDASDDGPASIDSFANNEELDLYGFAMERYIDQFELA